MIIDSTKFKQTKNTLNSLLSFLAFLYLILPQSIFANVEVFQVISFHWDQETKKITPTAFGSGTAIDKNLILTNKHVVSSDDGTADFILLCQGTVKKSRSITCNIPAAVTKVHDSFDAAMIRPLNSKTFFPKVKIAAPKIYSKDQVLIKGYPVPDQRFSNFGNEKTSKAIKEWTEKGGVLNFSGDEVTITRGNVTQIATRQSNNARYLITNAKVNFGNSGGSAFDRFENFIGIPTLKDSNGNALILDYENLRSWVQEFKNTQPQISAEILSFLKKLNSQSIKNKKNTQITKTKSSLMQRLTKNKSQKTLTKSKTSSRLSYHQKLQQRRKSSNYRFSNKYKNTPYTTSNKASSTKTLSTLERLRARYAQKRSAESNN